MLFELLTGRKPHEGDGAIQVAWKHVHEDIPVPSEHTAQHVPDYVDALVRSATARDPDRRPRDARVFLLFVRRARAALDAGVRDDPELASDFLPRSLGVDTTSIDYVDDSPTVVTPLDDEHTTVIDRDGALAGASAFAAGAGAAAPTGPSSYAGLGDDLPTLRSSVPGPRTPPPTSPPATQKRRPQPRRNRRGLILFIGVLALVVLVALAGWWLGMGRFTSTPGVINQPESVARDKIEAAGLEFEVGDREFSETVTAGSVISTDPGAGARIVQGHTVEAVISKGPERYAVPRLHGKALDKATELLQANNLTLGDVTEVFHETVPEGLVVRATPKAGTELQPEAAVSVTVSKGPKPIRIPDFTGKDAGRAESALTEKGFKVESTEENSDTIPKGDVISQTPSSGKGFKDDVIELVVSKGPVMVAVPPLRGDSVEDATATLRDLGFQVKVVKTSLYFGLDTVVRQDPAGGDLAPKGSTVTLSIV